MKKIFFSSAVIIAISAMVVGATTAYFSDTETIAENTIQAGTIDISLGDPLTTFSVDVQDLKPGMTQWIEFDVYNNGQNPVVLRKRLTNFISETGIVSEPECSEQGGEWMGEGEQAVCLWPRPGMDSNNLIPYLTYDMELFPEVGEDVVLIPESRNVKLSDVRDLWIPIGTLEPGKSLTVKQSYHLDEETGNWAQGDVLTFDINIHGEQRMGAGPTTTRGVVMENKDEVDWYSIMDETWGILTYNPSGSEFVYEFRGFGLVPGKTYKLVAWDDETDSRIVDFRTGLVADSNGEISVSGSYEFNMDLTEDKIWLRPQGWGNNSNTLWEGNRINYNDTQI